MTDAIGDGMKGGPLAVFDEEGRTFLLSPYSGFMASSSWHDSKKGGTVYWGIMGGVDKVPANYTYSTIIYYAEGINKVIVCNMLFEDTWFEFCELHCLV